MATATGFFDSTGCPALEIGISGVIQKPPTEFDAHIDTGFAGFISMPMVAALPLGLILSGTMMVVLADGSSSARLTASGTVWLGADSQYGEIILEPDSNELLLGMELLRAFHKR